MYMMERERDRENGVCISVYVSEHTEATGRYQMLCYLRLNITFPALSYSLRQGPMLLDWQKASPSQPPISGLHSAGNPGMCHQAWLLHGCWDLNSGLHS